MRDEWPGLLHIALPALLAARAGPGVSAMQVDFSEYAHQVIDGTVALHWNCSRPSPGVAQVQGLANDPFSPAPPGDLGFRLRGRGAAEDGAGHLRRTGAVGSSV